MRSARSRISISRANARPTRCATRSTRICGRIRSRCCRPSRCADDFDARFSAVRRHYLYRIVNRRARPRARARPRLARAAPARRRGDARGGAAAGRQARLHDVPLDRMPGQVAGEDARPARRVARAATRFTSPPSARSFLHNQVRSMVGSLVLVGDGNWSADDLRARARRARPRRLRPGGAAGRALSGEGGLLRRPTCIPPRRGGWRARRR